MAIGPQTQIRDSIRDLAEEAIDKCIRENMRFDRITIGVELLGPGFNQSDWEYLKPKYLKAGWSVAEWVLDQREGDYLNLKA